MQYLAILSALLVSLSVYPKIYTLSSLQDRYLEKSYKNKVSEIDLEASEESLRRAKMEYYPKFGIQYTFESISNDLDSDAEHLSSVYTEVNLFKGFKDKETVQKKKIIRDMSIAKHFDQEFRSQLYIEKLFYHYMFLERKSAIFKDERKRSIFHRDLVKKRFRSKLVTETDYLEFRLYLNKLNNIIESNELEKHSVFNEIFLTVGEESLDTFKINGELPHLHIEFKLEDIVKKVKESPHIKIRDMAYLMAERDYKIKNGGWYPKVNLKAEYGRLDEVETGVPSTETSSKVMLQFDWELFSAGQTKSDISTAFLNKKKAEYIKSYSELNSVIKAQRSFKLLKMLEKSIDEEEDNLKISKKLYRMTLAEYKKGIKDSGALLSSSKEISERESRIYELKFNYILEKIKLEKLLGEKLNFQLVSH